MFNGFVISDIHFGANDSNVLMKELNDVFIKKIHSFIKKEENDLDLIVICGDLFDHKLSFNSVTSKNVILFIEELCKICLKYGIILRIVKGTKNHDLDQLNNFLYLQERNKKLDFRIITHICSETIKDKKILYIPEEYMENKEEFYHEFLYSGNEYDLCFIHGTFNFVQYSKQLTSSERPISDAPLFKYDEFKKIIKLGVFAGHIHEKKNYKKFIYYTGSFSRWVFGEEEEKGFYRFSISDDETLSTFFIKNKYAPKYVTVDASDIIDINASNIEKEIKKIDNYKKDNDIKYLRLNIDNENDKVINSNVLKEYFSNNTNKDGGVKINKVSSKLDIDKEESELEEKYSFIFNDEAGDDINGLASNIEQYLKVHDNISISRMDIVDILK